MSEWIKVSDRLPSLNCRILVYVNPKYTFANPIYDAFYDKYGFVDYRMNWPLDNILYWMPLPEPPED